MGKKAKLQIILDVSRLMCGKIGPSPSGIDRVELAYAQHLDALLSGELRFCAYHPLWRRYRRLDGDQARKRLSKVALTWRTGSPSPRKGTDTARLPCSRIAEAQKYGRVIVKVSPDHLDREKPLARLIAAERAQLVVMIHDLLPIQFPEFSGPGAEATHRRRLDVTAHLASHVIANSHDTAAALETHYNARPHPPITPVPLGFSPFLQAIEGGEETAASLVDPYFVCVGTIEPRKNHMLLLHMWRELSRNAARKGARPPTLYLVGKRGWENENILDLLERSPAVKAHVIEAGALGDGELATLMRGARALLAPSFAEGFDLPVAEALACGTPVLCSDIPAHREVGVDVPDYLHPLDGPGWLRLIEDYAGPNSTLRNAQLRRLKDWSIGDWHAHASKIYNICSNLVVDGRADR